MNASVFGNRVCPSLVGIRPGGLGPQCRMPDFYFWLEAEGSTLEHNSQTETYQNLEQWVHHPADEVRDTVECRCRNQKLVKPVEIVESLRWYKQASESPKYGPMIFKFWSLLLPVTFPMTNVKWTTHQYTTRPRHADVFDSLRTWFFGGL